MRTADNSAILTISVTKNTDGNAIRIFLVELSSILVYDEGVVDKDNLQKSTKNVACLLARTTDNSAFEGYLASTTKKGRRYAVPSVVERLTTKANFYPV